MHPIFWFWAPQIHFPWSGAVAQNIRPSFEQMIRSIPWPSGVAGIEEKAFGVASYGKQLGLISDVLLDLSKRSPPQSAEAQASLAKLEVIHAKIEDIKREEYGLMADGIVEYAESLRRQGGLPYQDLMTKLQPIFDAARAR